ALHRPIRDDESAKIPAGFFFDLDFLAEFSRDGRGGSSRLAIKSFVKIRMASAAAAVLLACVSTQAKQQTAGAPASPSQTSGSASASSSTAAKNPTHKKKRHHAAASSSASKSSGSASTTHTATAKGSTTRTGSSRRKKTARTRGQQKIDSDRAQEIQEALIREHYLSGEATGKWNEVSEAAMRKYQG